MSSFLSCQNLACCYPIADLPFARITPFGQKTDIASRSCAAR